jgi:hypothetical protein
MTSEFCKQTGERVPWWLDVDSPNFFHIETKGESNKVD